MNIVVWFSCGAASAVAAYETLRRYPEANVRVVNNPVIEEDEDNRRFLKDVEAWLGVPIEFANSEEFPDQSAESVWRKVSAMSFPRGAPCTLKLKKDARYAFERKNKIDFHVLGFTTDEKKRHERFVLTERENVLPVLIEAGLSKQDCLDFLATEGLRLPRVYAEGHPNANCIGCVKATSPTYWNFIRRVRPEVFAARAALSRELGVRLVRVNGNRIFLDELDPMAEGKPLKSLHVECGIFCEEKGGDLDEKEGREEEMNHWLLDLIR